MASFPAGNAFLRGVSSASSPPGAGRTTGMNRAPETVPGKVPFVASSVDRRDSRGSIAFKAVKLLGPPTRFEASKLKVVFLEDEMRKQLPCTIPRTYTLTHCDFTANLTLAVSSNISIDQLRRWQAKLQSDDVVAEWKRVREEMSLHVHCYVSGSNLLQDLAAEFRYHIFSKELPLVLKAVIHGDSVLFKEHPELMDASVWVYFHSNSKKYNRVECWGALKDATQRTLEDQTDGLQSIVKQRFAVCKPQNNFPCPCCIPPVSTKSTTT